MLLVSWIKSFKVCALPNVASHWRGRIYDMEVSTAPKAQQYATGLLRAHIKLAVGTPKLGDTLFDEDVSGQ